MTQSITNAIYIMVIGVLTAFLITAVFSLSKTSARNANVVASKTSSLVTQMSNYDLDRLDCEYVVGSEIRRIIERYNKECSITLFTKNRGTSYENSGVKFKESLSGTANYVSVADIYRVDKCEAYVKEDADFYVKVFYDENDNLDSIEIKEI